MVVVVAFRGGKHKTSKTVYQFVVGRVVEERLFPNETTGHEGGTKKRKTKVRAITRSIKEHRDIDKIDTLFHPTPQ